MIEDLDLGLLSLDQDFDRVGHSYLFSIMEGLVLGKSFFIVG